MKTYTFRHPGMADAQATVAAPEMADLSDADLRRLVRDFRYRLMTLDTALTVERFHFSPMISQTMWATLWRAAMEESHARAIAEHVRRGFRFTGFEVAARGPGDIRPSLGAFLRRTIANAGASDVRPAERDGKS